MSVEMLGLRIMVEGGSYFNVVMPTQDAMQIVKNWSSGMYKVRNVTVIGNFDKPDSDVSGLWAVKVDCITGMHTFNPQSLVQEAPK